MSKKKKFKDFWGTTAEDQLEEAEAFDAMEERGEIDIFSLGKIPKHYTGLEPEITADISRVFGNKKVTIGEEYQVAEDAFSMEVKESEAYVASLKSDSYDDNDDDIHFDPSFGDTKKPLFEAKIKDNSSDKAPKTSENTYSGKGTIDKLPNDSKSFDKKSTQNTSKGPQRIRFKYLNNILELKDGVVSLFYKVVKNGELRYIKDDVVYDDSVLREILYLVRDIIAFRYPTALYEFDEFETLFDEVKGTFIDSQHESRYMFIDFEDYVAVYYFGDKNFIEQLSDFRVYKSNAELADIIMGLAIESLDFNVAFTKDDFIHFYNSEANKVNKTAVIDTLKTDIDYGDKILMIDVHSFNNLFDRSEAIIEKYIKDGIDHDEVEVPTDEDTDLEDEINKLLSDENIDDDDLDDTADDSDDEDDDDIEYDEEIEDDDPEESEDDEEDDTEDETSDDQEESESVEEPESDEGDTEDIDTMIDEVVGDDEPEEEPTSMPIDKVAVNNPNKDQSMVVEVTRKTHA